MPKGLLHRALYRDTDGSSSSFGAGGLKSQDDSSQTVWGRGKPLAAIVFFAIYFYAWFYFRIELTFWLVHFASSLPAFPLGSPSTPNPTSYDYILSWYMLLVTSVLYTGIIAFSLFAVVPITWRLGLAPKWLEFYAVMFVGMVSTLAARLCVRQL
ncbi:hypothetical protein DL93DRAFT_2087662 [Clavulina sp. PMI_390]|nr:hypothetical protein DL93DRAFT_2087662 [Clavulina sp. PMI_390]